MLIPFTHYLAVVGALFSAATPDVVIEPVFEVWRAPAAGTTTSTESPYYNLRTPAWWDITQDGHPEAIFWSVFGIERLERSEEGGYELTPVAATSAAEKTYTDARVKMAVVDIDGDGQNELLAFTDKLADKGIAYRMTPDGVDIADVPLPPITLNCLYDVAVGDLNRDGLADLYLAMGCFHFEMYRQTGHPDLILMNRGNQRFEAITLEPDRRVLTTSVTIADVDGDGWLDVMESNNASWISGKSRLLMNRTAPGDDTPTFEPSEHTWDIGTDGMGAAIGDLNGDGYMDLFNTSIGYDLLLMGQQGGGFVDETLTRGLHHLWSSEGRRAQWSPTFTDLNADGRLDLLIRHGIRSVIGLRTTTTMAADLAYVQAADGAMVRSWTPFSEPTDDGVSFAVGDLEGDGLPDAARDAQPGGSLFWGNLTPVEATTRRLTVRLAPTVSGSPATGAVLTGTCGDTSLSRHITSGGKLGASAAYEAIFAWPGCVGKEVSLTVQWPSGATTTEALPTDATVWLAQEPRWFEPGLGDEVTLDPTTTQAEQACIADAEGTWSCCDARC
jgi:hypothetical protein